MLDHRLQIERSSLGKPLLLLNVNRGPSVSFTHLEGITWAAMIETGGSLGIDAASRLDFQEGYPLHRVFHREEVSIFSALLSNPEAAAAALWSA